MTNLQASGGDDGRTRRRDGIQDRGRVEELDVLRERRGHGVLERADACHTGIDVREDREVGRKEVVRLGHGDGDLEHVAGGRNGLCRDAVLREPFGRGGEGVVRGLHEGCDLQGLSLRNQR